MKRLVWIILGLLALGLSIAAYIYRDALTAMMRETSDVANGEGDDEAEGGEAPLDEQSIWALGRLAPAGGIINLSATPGDQLLELYVAEGDQVDTQKPLGKLQSDELREDEIEQLTIQLREATERLEAQRTAAENELEAARLAEAEATEVAEREIAAQRAKAQALELAATQAARELERLTNLKAEAPDLVSDQQIDQAQLAHERARAELEAAQVAIASAEVSSNFRIRLATQQREAAEAALGRVEKTAPIASLEKQLETARDRAERSLLRSPIAGTVLKIFTQPGETVGQQPILQIADVSQMVCIAEVSHDQVQRIQVGMEARVRSRAFPNDLEPDYLLGAVQSKSLVAATPELREIDPFAASDRHVMEVRIELTDESSRIASPFIHLQVDVEFVTRSAPEEP